MKHYHLDSNQADRISFDEMLRRALEETIAGLDDYYRTIDPETAINVLWDLYSQEYTDQGCEYADETGLICVQNMEEAEGRFASVVLSLITPKGGDEP